MSTVEIRRLMFPDKIVTEPAGQDSAPSARRTHRANVGSYDFLCRTGASPVYDFTYSHVRFGTVVWHR